MSASQVLNAPTYQSILAPNDALQDSNFATSARPENA